LFEQVSQSNKRQANFYDGKIIGNWCIAWTLLSIEYQFNQEETVYLD
jgi:hypothetical protein